jgi:pilus assembly protein Flp/PilA
MNTIFARLHVRLHELQSDEQGQDLVEYALLVSLIALLCIAGIGNVAVAVNGAFSIVSTSLA